MYQPISQQKLEDANVKNVTSPNKAQLEEQSSKFQSSWSTSKVLWVRSLKCRTVVIESSDYSNYILHISLATDTPEKKYAVKAFLTKHIS